MFILLGLHIEKESSQGQPSFYMKAILADGGTPTRWCHDKWYAGFPFQTQSRGGVSEDRFDPETVKTLDRG